MSKKQSSTENTHTTQDTTLGEQLRRTIEEARVFSQENSHSMSIKNPSYDFHGRLLARE